MAMTKSAAFRIPELGTVVIPAPHVVCLIETNGVVTIVLTNGHTYQVNEQISIVRDRFGFID